MRWLFTRALLSTAPEKRPGGDVTTKMQREELLLVEQHGASLEIIQDMTEDTLRRT